MIKNGRLSQNPLMPVQKLAFVPAWTRRAFRDDELRRLLEVASESRLGYLLAVYTGLRRSELKALCWENVDLDGEVPTVSLSGRFTKNKQNACIPLHPQVLEELGASKPADAKPSDAVLMGKMLPSMWKMKKDLRRAGIPHEENGRRADFHSLRHTLATNLARQNVAPRVAMQLLRHSDIRLTMNHYTDASQLPVAEAIGKLPCFGSAGSADTGHGNTQRHSQTPDISSNEQSPSGTSLADAESPKVVYPEEFWHNQPPIDTIEQPEEKSCLARTRT